MTFGRILACERFLRRSMFFDESLLRRSAYSGPSAHESIATNIRNFERRHLSTDLPKLRAKQDDRPSEL